MITPSWHEGEHEVRLTAPLYRFLGYGYDDPLVEIKPMWGSLDNEKYVKDNAHIFGEYHSVLGFDPDFIVDDNIHLYNPTYDKLGRLVGYDYAAWRINNNYVCLCKLLELDHDKDGEEILIYKVDWVISPDFWVTLNNYLELPF